jgi:spermidine synthase
VTGKRSAVATAWALGVLAMVGQTVLLREFLGVADGNELVLGLVLGCWMILTGIGAILARRSAAGFVRGLYWRILILAFFPLLTALALRVVRGVVFAPGRLLGLPETLVVALLLLAPFCIVAGHTFVRLATLLVADGCSIASTYGWEAAGSVTGALAGFLLTASALRNIEILAWLALFGGVVALVSSPRKRTTVTLWRAALVLGPGLLVVCSAGTLDLVSRTSLAGGQEVLFTHDSPYGSLVVTTHDGARCLFENGVLLAAAEDVTGREEASHFAMVQRRSPRRVLVVSGAAGGILEEVLKYPVEEVEYVELDPGIRHAAPYLRPLPVDARVKVIDDDVRNVLRSGGRPYDVLLVNTPDPATAQANRLFTVEFLRLANTRMDDSSVLVLSMLPSADYYGGRARLVASSVYSTLRTMFPCVIVVPGERNYFLASASPLDPGIARLVAARKIPTTAVNGYYIDDDLLRSRSRRFADALDSLAPVNSDLHPVVYFRQIAFWLESVGWSVELIGWATVVLLLAGLAVVSRVGAGIYAAGFAASGIEVILLFGFQCLYGFIYRSLWLVIGGFMGGLAAGSALAAKAGPVPARRWFLGGLSALASCGVISAVLLEYLVHSGRADLVGMATLLVSVTLAGTATGIVFGAGSYLASGSTGGIAGTLYAADLAGSALGSLLAAVFLLPTLGTGIAAGVMGILPVVAILLFVRWPGPVDGPQERSMG